MNDLIRVQNLNKRFAKGFALENVSLSVEEGSVTGFVGANGAGKTTTIRAILGLTPIDSGTITVFGERMGPNIPAETQRRVKESIGVVMDTCPFFPEMSIKVVGDVMRASYPAWRQGVFEDYLLKFGLEPKKRVKELSRGMGMKLQLACALSHEPDLLILDEATAGLDPLAREEVLDLLRNHLHAERRGILISSHITSDLEKLADTVVGIDNGRITFNLATDQITDEMGIARCRTAEFERIAASELFEEGALRFIRHEYGIDLLVPDRFAFARRFPDIACDKTTIDSYLQLITKGETR